MYKNTFGFMNDVMATVRSGKMVDTVGNIKVSGRLILKNGRVIDPKNSTDRICDIVIAGGVVVETSSGIKPESGDKIIDCEGLYVIPGLIDMHLHLGDLFEVSTEPIFRAVQDGVTMGLSPGAGNTLMGPSLLGAEVDRGVPMNLGLYLGAASLLGTCLEVDEYISFFKGELDPDIASRRLTRNSISNTTGNLVMGIKDHMGHYIQPDERIDMVYEICDKANMIFMSHTQDPEHAERVVGLSKGRPVHLGHATAAGCGTHDSPESGMRRILDLVDGNNVTAEFVTSMLRPGRGNREGLLLPKEAQKLAYEALSSGKVKVLISDGQCQATMKGFGDTIDNVPVILELADMGVLTLSESVATMTSNVSALIGKKSSNPWWEEKTGHLGAGALANVTIIDPHDKQATYTIVNGKVTSFEKHTVRANGDAGGWMCHFGMLKKTGVGDFALYSYVK